MKYTAATNIREAGGLAPGPQRLDRCAALRGGINTDGRRPEIRRYWNFCLHRAAALVVSLLYSERAVAPIDLLSQ